MCFLGTIFMINCGGCDNKMKSAFEKDVEFLKNHTDAIVLAEPAGQARVAVVPQYQGRVMTSTIGGDSNSSFGWINKELISSGQLQKHINVFGGEDRFWMGPEGGQFAIFFEKGDPFDLEHWQTPALFDTEPFKLVSRSQDRAYFQKRGHLKNYSQTSFDVEISRTVRVLGRDQAQQKLNCPIPSEVKLVAYESENKLTNCGSKAWNKDSGLLSIWILGIFKHSPKTTIVIPFHAGTVEELGPKVNADYFGRVPDDRLIVRDNVLFFKADGKYRSKIGLSPLRAKSVLGSYDGVNNVLTLVTYNQVDTAKNYVNSAWEIQKFPYKGDVVNAYNDGPPSPGKKPFGPFYELETSSPAFELAPAQSIVHIHSTYHFQGPVKELSRIAEATLGVTVSDIEQSFN